MIRFIISLIILEFSRYNYDQHLALLIVLVLVFLMAFSNRGIASFTIESYLRRRMMLIIM